MESVATGAGSHPRTQQSDMSQSTFSCSSQPGSPSCSIHLYSSDYVATLPSRLDIKSTSTPKSRLAEWVLGHIWSQMIDMPNLI